MPHMSHEGRDAMRAAHHQIGNSLQSVASLLRLESRSAPPEAATALNEAGRRIRTVMRLHQRLQEGDGDVVRLDDLLGDVCRDVAELDAVDRDAEIRVDIQPFCTGAKTASALALITAELLGNALEHGLAGRAGRVEVSLRMANGGATLTVRDDGAGAPEGELKAGFGLSLVARLADQLGAQLEQTTGASGTQFELACRDVWWDSSCV
ncbi:sensor histidine kinase [Brevundimonas sp.]|uniref:sensor histidine kinase n=1 Tax=Brevundimonas sp. TaxID=1871086 RepID=UPI002D8024CD|nr:sensor histidine kinase [Brevundimonas sp.]